MVAMRASSSTARNSLWPAFRPALIEWFMPEEIAITVIHQAGTWASDPLTLLMLPSMASTSAASYVEPVPLSRETSGGLGSSAVGGGW